MKNIHSVKYDYKSKQNSRYNKPSIIQVWIRKKLELFILFLKMKCVFLLLTFKRFFQTQTVTNGLFLKCVIAIVCKECCKLMQKIKLYCNNACITDMINYVLKCYYKQIAISYIVYIKTMFSGLTRFPTYILLLRSVKIR